jgi:hypothetical protein
MADLDEKGKYVVLSGAANYSFNCKYVSPEKGHAHPALVQIWHSTEWLLEPVANSSTDVAPARTAPKASDSAKVQYPPGDLNLISRTSAGATTWTG